jgi:NAD(P)-dependent dehydrogenase (short-subunit alcohol dehydrogenase family)
VDAIEGLKSDRITTSRLDVTDPDSIGACVETVIRREGRIDILVNNAGYGQIGPTLELTLDQLREQLETNVIGAVAVTQAVVPHMIEKRQGRITNIGSVSGILTTPFAGAYCASKAALHRLSEALRMELAPAGIEVIIVQPGGVKSSFGENSAGHVRLPDHSRYEPVRDRIMHRARIQQENATPSEEVARDIVRAVTADSPPYVLRTGRGCHLYPGLKRWVPSRVLDRLLMRRFGLDQLAIR